VRERPCSDCQRELQAARSGVHDGVRFQVKKKKKDEQKKQSVVEEESNVTVFGLQLEWCLLCGITPGVGPLYVLLSV
jgi:hypothetical protein